MRYHLKYEADTCKYCGAKKDKNWTSTSYPKIHRRYFKCETYLTPLGDGSYFVQSSKCSAIRMKRRDARISNLEERVKRLESLGG